MGDEILKALMLTASGLLIVLGCVLLEVRKYRRRSSTIISYLSKSVHGDDSF
jgi:hypothetical protein